MRQTAQTQIRKRAVLLSLMGRRPLPALLAEVVEASAVLPLADRTNLLGLMVGLASIYLEAGL
jgi:hypothetical protein